MTRDHVSRPWHLTVHSQPLSPEILRMLICRSVKTTARESRASCLHSHLKKTPECFRQRFDFETRAGCWLCQSPKLHQRIQEVKTLPPSHPPSPCPIARTKSTASWS